MVVMAKVMVNFTWQSTGSSHRLPLSMYRCTLVKKKKGEKKAFMPLSPVDKREKVVFWTTFVLFHNRIYALCAGHKSVVYIGIPFSPVT